MLNYLSAECYKLRRKKGLWLGVALLLLLEAVPLTPAFWTAEASDGHVQETCLAFFSTVISVGIFIAPIFALLAFDGQYSQGTLKNEIVYGVPRSRIYLGKLLTGALAGSLCAVAAAGWYLLGVLLLFRGDAQISPALWGEVGAALAVSWLVWLSALSFTQLLLFALRSTVGAMIAVYLLTIVVTPLALVGYGQGSAGPSRDVLYWSSRLYYAAPYRVLWSGGGHPILYGAAICLGWLTATTLLGLAVFRRQEIQ